MAILTQTCPHCLTSHIGLKIIAGTPINGERWAAHLKCPKCFMPSCAVMMYGNRGAHSWTNHAQYEGDIDSWGWYVTDSWPQQPEPIIPENLPPDVAKAYLQAERNFSILGNEEAAGMMYGKALDIGLLTIDPTLKGMLGLKIKKLSEAGKLTSDLSEWSGQIRDIRNDATHEQVPISRDELAALRSFSEMVLRYLFTLPGAVKKRRGEKLDWE